MLLELLAHYFCRVPLFFLSENNSFGRNEQKSKSPLFWLEDKAKLMSSELSLWPKAKRMSDFHLETAWYACFEAYNKLDIMYGCGNWHS